jgi:hypothetical protein
MKKSILLVFSFVLLFSCQEVDLPTPESENIIGEWEWLESVGGISGTGQITPSSQGETRQLEFKKNGKFRYCRDDKKEDKGDFTITANSDSWGEYLVLKLEGDETSKSGLSFLSSDTIQLVPVDCADCYSASYVRK